MRMGMMALIQPPNENPPFLPKAAKAPKAGGEKHTRPVPPEKAEPQLSIRQ